MDKNQDNENHDNGYRKWLSVCPQVIAATVVFSLNLFVGQMIAYSGVIIPQMLEEQNSTNEKAIPINESDSAWIASAPFLSGLVASLLCGVLTDSIGRLKTIMLSGISGIISLCLIATASNMFSIICGRFIVGIAIVFIGNPTIIYISEISKPNIRGSLLTLSEVFGATGVVLVYLKGWVMHWKTIAWIANLYLIIPIIAMFFLPESPVWLVSKKRMSQAKKSLTWLYKFTINNSNLVEEELKAMENEQQQKELQEKFNWKDQLKMFLLPTFYKPFLILTVIFFIQQFTGVFLVMFNSVIFCQEIGTTVDPYLVSIYIFSVKVAITFVEFFLMRKFNRRTLLLVSAGGMAVSVSLSGLNTYWIQQGTSNYPWVPLSFLLLYIVFSSIGITIIPYIIAGELFSLKIRGVAYSLIVALSSLFVFAISQCYFLLYHLFGGSANLQYFFASMCLLMMVFVFLFLPETHKRKLIDIENYFWKHTIYIRSRENGA